jgi:serine/threonine protein kinase
VDSERQPRLEVGREIGRYRVLGALGAGGMGEVYLAEDRELSRRVAIKLLGGWLAQDEERAKRFRQEARTSFSAQGDTEMVNALERGQRQAGYAGAMREHFRMSPELRELRPDPRYKDLLRRLNLADDQVARSSP